MHCIFLPQECRYRIALPENYTIKFSCDDFGLQVGCSGVLEPNAHGCAHTVSAQIDAGVVLEYEIFCPRTWYF